MLKPNFVEELRWRGLIHNIIEGTEEQFNKEKTTAYIGFDPTSDSLHIGSLVPIILLCHLFNYGHQPIAIVGGATGMIGDPSGKSDERNLLDEETLNKNVEGIKRVLSRFLDFNSTQENRPILENNYHWMKEFSFISFVRDVGKKITVNYMMSKDSVKKRLTGEAGSGMSFTEFTYQLIQGYDFYHLNKTYNCKVQLGGSDQWGNITTGTELIRRLNDEETHAFAITCPLITKSDGSKFGKSEKGNIWLDADKTSPYLFYQFWLKVSDEDAEKYIKIFTFLSKEQTEELIENHRKEPHLYILQKKLAEQVTLFVHGNDALEKAIQASEILFGKATKEALYNLDEQTFLSIFDGVPQKEIFIEDDLFSFNIIDFLSEITGFLASKSEVRRALKENSLAINQEKTTHEEFQITKSYLIGNQYLLIERGKKNKFIVKFIKKA
jgi:tyrosyl-tRNA synthetase